jgi:hypothetical protein
MRTMLRILCTGLTLSACSAASPPIVPPGQWSAPEANLYVAADGTRLELTCRLAALPAEVRLDSRGRFRVDTTMAQVGVTVVSFPVTIAGWLDGQVLRLTVTPRQPGGPVEEYVLSHRSAPHLPLCG